MCGARPERERPGSTPVTPAQGVLMSPEERKYDLIEKSALTKPNPITEMLNFAKEPKQHRCAGCGAHLNLGLLVCEYCAVLFRLER